MTIDYSNPLHVEVARGIVSYAAGPLHRAQRADGPGRAFYRCEGAQHLKSCTASVGEPQGIREVALTRADARREDGMADFTFQNHGSIWLVAPEHNGARAHLAAHVGDEAQWFGGALAVEPRYVPDLIDNLIHAGFRVYP